jgi:hypothetical protein
MCERLAHVDRAEAALRDLRADAHVAALDCGLSEAEERRHDVRVHEALQHARLGGEVRERDGEQAPEDRADAVVLHAEIWVQGAAHTLGVEERAVWGLCVALQAAARAHLLHRPAKQIVAS